MKFRGPQALVDTRVRPFSFLSRKRIYFKTQRLIDSVTRTLAVFCSPCLSLHQEQHPNCWAEQQRVIQVGDSLSLLVDL